MIRFMNASVTALRHFPKWEGGPVSGDPLPARPEGRPAEWPNKVQFVYAPSSCTESIIGVRVASPRRSEAAKLPDR